MPESADRDEPLTFRWLGVAGVELRIAGQVLLIDPFLTRPPLRRLLFGRVEPHPAFLEALLPRCDAILVSHAHWDHLLDVPAIARYTGAAVFGSPHTCRLAEACGVPPERINLIRAGDRFTLGAFDCDVLAAHHGRTPLDPLINGPLPADLRPPLRLRDYRMDTCLGFAIQVGGVRILHLPGRARPADVLIIAATTNPRRHAALLPAVGARVVIPVHWDNLFRPISAPLRPMLAPPAQAWPPLHRMQPRSLAPLVDRLTPGARLLIPDPFTVYPLATLAAAGG